MYKKFPCFKMVKAYSHFQRDVKGINLDSNMSNIIVAGNMHGSFKVFDIITGKTLVSFDDLQEQQYTYCVSINRNKHIAAGFIEYALIWDLKTRKCQKLLSYQLNGEQTIQF